MDTRTSIPQNPSVLLQLAWAELDEDEFVDRLANEVWKRPISPYLITNNGGAVGVSMSKAEGFVRRMGKHFPASEKKRLTERVYMTALAKFRAQCAVWAHEIAARVIRNARDCMNPTKAEIQRDISAMAPKGSHEEIRTYIYDEIHKQTRGRNT